MREASFEDRDLHLTGQGKDILIEVHLSATRSDAEEHALVLLAMGIGCAVVEDDSVFALLVSAPNAMSAREQLALVVRLACAMAVAEEGGAPVILDDALGHSDAGRLADLGRAIAAAGRACQVIVLTCAPDRYVHGPDARVVALR